MNRSFSHFVLNKNWTNRNIKKQFESNNRYDNGQYIRARKTSTLAFVPHEKDTP